MDSLSFLETPVVLTLLVLTSVVSYRAFSDPGLQQQLIFNPYRMVRTRQWHPLFTHGLLHADYVHLVFNMFALYSFGVWLERMLGPIEFFGLYVTALVVSCLPDLIRHRDFPGYQALGASGAVSAVMFSYILFDPSGMLYFFFFPMPGWLFALLFIAYSIYADYRRYDNIGHAAHLWGALWGLAMTAILRPDAAARVLRWAASLLS
ncbi:MAG: rhomboid family intramembrane serine protease [Bacteroidia bacterium]|nr:rhomboid family intramembrane serine protease [Bacteroidia bacterium]